MVSVANRKILFPGETEWFQIFLFETFFLFLIKNNGFCCKQNLLFFLQSIFPDTFRV
jgi:hypothetical protein